MSKVEVFFEKGLGVVTVKQKVTEKELIEAIQKAGPSSGTIKKPVKV